MKTSFHVYENSWHMKMSEHSLFLCEIFTQYWWSPHTYWWFDNFSIGDNSGCCWGNSCYAKAEWEVLNPSHEYVKPFRDEAMFLNCIWLSFGKPHDNIIHNPMKRIWNGYHYQLRKSRKAAENWRINVVSEIIDIIHKQSGICWRLW